MLYSTHFQIVLVELLFFQFAQLLRFDLLLSLRLFRLINDQVVHEVFILTQIDNLHGFVSQLNHILGVQVLL